MNLTDVKPLTPLTHGSVLIVGCKASNFDDDLRNHPRIIMWESQQEHWSNKDLPHNVQAVFLTRWVGHAVTTRLITDARKKRITVFNTEGTGMIARQVKELLGLSKPTTVEIKPTMTQTTPPVSKTQKDHSKLNPLMQFVDPSKTIIDNAKALIVRAKEMGIETTVGSIAQKLSVQRRKGTVSLPNAKIKVLATPRVKAKMDVSVEILDNVIKELQDMRDYIVAVTKENDSLKTRIEKFKKALDND